MKKWEGCWVTHGILDELNLPIPWRAWQHTIPDRFAIGRLHQDKTWIGQIMSKVTVVQVPN